MRNKTFLLTITLSALFIVLFFSCQKFETKQADNELTETALADASFSPGFNWETTRNITLNISSENSQILNITSTDKSIRYYKGILLDKSETYVVKISVPTHVEKLSINSQEFNLDSDNISINL